MNKTLLEVLIILLITALLSLVYCAVSPLGRILFNKALRVRTDGATFGTATEARYHR